MAWIGLNRLLLKNLMGGFFDCEDEHSDSVEERNFQCCRMYAEGPA
jgi:hypothetical protein